MDTNLRTRGHICLVYKLQGSLLITTHCIAGNFGETALMWYWRNLNLMRLFYDLRKTRIKISPKFPAMWYALVSYLTPQPTS